MMRTGLDRLQRMDFAFARIFIEKMRANWTPGQSRGSSGASCISGELPQDSRRVSPIIDSKFTVIDSCFAPKDVLLCTYVRGRFHAGQTHIRPTFIVVIIHPQQVALRRQGRRTPNPQGPRYILRICEMKKPMLKCFRDSKIASVRDGMFPSGERQNICRFCGELSPRPPRRLRIPSF